MCLSAYCGAGSIVYSDGSCRNYVDSKKTIVGMGTGSYGTEYFVVSCYDDFVTLNNVEAYCSHFTSGLKSDKGKWRVAEFRYMSLFLNSENISRYNNICNKLPIWEAEPDYYSSPIADYSLIWVFDSFMGVCGYSIFKSTNSSSGYSGRCTNVSHINGATSTFQKTMCMAGYDELFE